MHRGLVHKYIMILLQQQNLEIFVQCGFVRKSIMFLIFEAKAS
jgi:hypothetical protein